MQQDKQINYKTIEALGNILLNAIVENKEDRVLKNIDRLYLSIEKVFKLPDNEFKNVFLNKEYENKNLYWKVQENYSLIFNTYLDLFVKCIKKALEYNSHNIAIELKLKFNSLLRNILLTKKDFNLLEIYFKKQEELFEYSLNNNYALSHSFGYQWYYDLVYNWLKKDSIFDLDFLIMFDKQIFKYIKYAIDKKNTQWLNNWIEWLHHGIGFMNLNSFSKYTYFGHYSKITDYKNIDEKFNKIYSKSTYFEFIDTLTKLQNEWISNDSSNKYKKEKQFRETVKKAQLKYFFHNTKLLIFSSFSYSLYKNSYALLFKMLNINKESKTNVIQIGHEVLPQSFEDIIKMWLKEDIKYFDDENWKFKFGKSFSENNYYESLLTYILIIWLNIKEAQVRIFTNYTLYELMYLENVINDFIIKPDLEDIVKQINSEINFDSEKKNIQSIIKKSLNLIKSKIKKTIDNKEPSSKKMDELKISFFEKYFNNSNHIKYILNTIDKNIFETKEYNTTKKRFLIKDNIPKDYFIEETNTCVEYLGEKLAEDFIISENTQFINSINNNSEIIFESKIEETINKIGIDNIIILSTNYSDTLNKNKSFKNSWEVSNELNLDISPNGFFKYKNTCIPIFSFYTNDNKANTFFINKNKFINWIDYIPSKKETINNINRNIFLSFEKNDKNVLLTVYSIFDITINSDIEIYKLEG